MNERINELEYLSKRSKLIVDFIISKNPQDPILHQYKTIIENAVKKKDLRGMRIIARDTNAWAKGLSQKEIIELEEKLFSEFKENLSGDKVTLKTIDELLTRGTIQTEDEYRIIHDYLQDLSKGDPFFERISELESLLNTY